jgi:hypothetical protein
MNKKGAPTFSKALDKKIHPYMTPPTLAGKEGVESMGVPVPKEVDLSKRNENSKPYEKIAKESINTSNMSKSIFDKLFEDVMSGADDLASDASDLGIGSDASDDMGGDMGGDEVTFTLDRETAQKLLDVIGAAMSGSEDEGDLDGEGGFGGEGEEEFGGEDEEEGEKLAGESIEVIAEPKPFGAKPETLQNKNNKVNSKYKPSGGKAHTGSIAPLQAEPKAFTAKPETLQNKNNKVAGFSTSGTIFGS